MLGVMAVRLLWTACCMVAQFRAAQAAHRWAELEARVYGGSTHLSSLSFENRATSLSESQRSRSAASTTTTAASPTSAARRAGTAAAADGEPEGAGAGGGSLSAPEEEEAQQLEPPLPQSFPSGTGGLELERRGVQIDGARPDFLSPKPQPPPASATQKPGSSFGSLDSAASGTASGTLSPSSESGEYGSEEQTRAELMKRYGILNALLDFELLLLILQTAFTIVYLVLTLVVVFYCEYAGDEPALLMGVAMLVSLLALAARLLAGSQPLRWRELLGEGRRAQRVWEGHYQGRAEQWLRKFLCIAGAPQYYCPTVCACGKG